MIGVAAGRQMELALGARTGAGCGETSRAALAQSDGHRDRGWQTRAGNGALRIPTLRTGGSFASGLEPPRASEKALVAVLQDACTDGKRPRALDDLVRAMRGTATSKSQVSRLCEAIDERVDTILTGPIAGDWPCPWIGATCLKV